MFLQSSYQLTHILVCLIPLGSCGTVYRGLWCGSVCSLIFDLHIVDMKLHSKLNFLLQLIVLHFLYMIIPGDCQISNILGDSRMCKHIHVSKLVGCFRAHLYFCLNELSLSIVRIYSTSQLGTGNQRIKRSLILIPFWFDYWYSLSVLSEWYLKMVVSKIALFSRTFWAWRLLSAASIYCIWKF